MVWRRYYQNRTRRFAEGQPLGRRIPVSGHFCIWPAKRACRKTQLSLFEIIRLLKGTPAEDRPEWLVLENVKICSPLIEDGTLRPFSIHWPKSAIISNTDCLIHASTAFRKTGSESTLSLIDILEPTVDEKYFLSPQATARLLYS